MEQKLVQRCETEIVADACNASQLGFNINFVLLLVIVSVTVQHLTISWQKG